jgi:hypothetical protein
MSYVNKNIQSLINHADVCGGGMKKAGLVYGSDWSRIAGSIVLSKTATNITFTLHGSMNTNACCGQIATTGLHSSQRAYRNYRTAFN